MVEKLKRLHAEFSLKQDEMARVGNEMADELYIVLDNLFKGKEKQMLVFDHTIPIVGADVKYITKSTEEQVYVAIDLNGKEYDILYELPYEDIGYLTFAIIDGDFKWYEDNEKH